MPAAHIWFRHPAAGMLERPERLEPAAEPQPQPHPCTPPHGAPPLLLDAQACRGDAHSHQPLQHTAQRVVQQECPSRGPIPSSHMVILVQILACPLEEEHLHGLRMLLLHAPSSPQQLRETCTAASSRGVHSFLAPPWHLRSSLHVAFQQPPPGEPLLLKVAHSNGALHVRARRLCLTRCAREPRQWAVASLLSGDALTEASFPAEQ
mmetsp:Transcript_21653/g.41323  ORF Transcript_21653/g.41323 Transcript_21653/m.41323 type:complete len:207 (-) Transcript_21653:2290-2910(-)